MFSQGERVGRRRVTRFWVRRERGPFTFQADQERDFRGVRGRRDAMWGDVYCDVRAAQFFCYSCVKAGGRGEVGRPCLFVFVGGAIVRGGVVRGVKKVRWWESRWFAPM